MHGWNRTRDERTGPWARLPSPADDLLGPGADPVETWHPGSTTFPQPSAGRPVFLPSASRAPSTSGSASEVLARPYPQPWHHPTPGPRHQSTPRHQPAPAPPAAPPRVIPLGGDLALVSVGQWDEESATTIQMPAVVDELEAPADQAQDSRPASDRD